MHRVEEGIRWLQVRMMGLLGAAMILAPSAASSKPVKVAVFDFQFAHNTPVKPTEEDLTRLKRTSNAFRRLLQESGRFKFVPIEAVKAEVEKMGDLSACTDTYAKTLGASATFVREVQKVSNLILNMNVYYKYLGGEVREQVYTVHIRGNADELSKRSIEYLANNQVIEYSNWSRCACKS